jgi:glycosyltransferase involved in cell wall biosynthesis
VAKNIVIFTNHFFPEHFKVNDIAFHWADQGHKVKVITGLPNYPFGKVFDGYGIFKKSSENVNGVQVTRLPLITRGKGGKIRLALNYASYLISMIFYLPVLLLKRVDIVFVHHTSPIFIGIPAALLAKAKGAKLLFWNLDLWPESVSAAGNVKQSSVLIHILNNLVRWIYHKCSIISSKGFESSIGSKITKSIPIKYLPNWAEESMLVSQHQTMPEFDQLPKDKLKVFFAGNMGEAQDLQSLVKAIEGSKSLNVHWVFVGDGRKRAYFMSEIERLHLQHYVTWMGRYPVEQMPSIYQYADVMLVSLKPDPIFSLTLPAKVQSYMACKKPILGMLSGEGMQVIQEAECGLCVDAGNHIALLNQLELLNSLSKEALKKLGENGYAYFQNNFIKQIVFNRLDAEL